MILTLALPMQGKARPRVTRHGTFMPLAYRQWQQSAQLELRSQWGDRLPLEAVAQIAIRFRCRSGRTDLDNAIGSVLDALVRAGILRDDNATRVPAIAATWERSLTDSIAITLEET